MFDALTLHGGEATIAFVYHTAAVCKSWTIRQSGRAWILSAVITRADPFKLRQAPLRFVVPRKGGFLYWPVVSCALTDAAHLSATLGPPEG